MTEGKHFSQEPPEQPPADASSKLRDRRSQPEGIVPRQSQAYIIAGLAVLILVAVLFSKGHPRPPGKAAAPAAATPPAELNERKIADLKEELNTAQRASEQAAPASHGASVTPPPALATSPGSAPPSASPQPMQASEEHRDPIADAERALAFKARFSSNLISGIENRQSANADENDTAALDRSHTSSLSTENDKSAATNVKYAPEVNVNSAAGQPFVLFEGTMIDTTLVNRLDGDFSGPVKVMVTNPVYSHDGQHVLAPEGTFLLGDVQKVDTFGQRRLAVTFHRLLMPDGYSVDLDRFHGLSQIGETGLSDKVNNHYVEIFGTSIALGLIAGAAEATTNSSGYSESGSDEMRQGVASSLAQSGAHVLDKFLNVLPTITIREGHRIKVYLSDDLLLPAYENHRIPSDI